MINCRIFDDQYWEKIYNWISKVLTKYNFPIKNNVNSPIPFINKILNWDIILLDNYFPWETWEEPIWNDFLQLYIEKWLNCKIICISDYWKVLLDKYISRDLVDQKWDIIWWVPTKDIEEISGIISWNLNQEL